MTRYSFDGLKTFTSLERAAQWAVDGDEIEQELYILEGGELYPLSDAEYNEYATWRTEYILPL